jgi:hypothetical protein
MDGGDVNWLSGAGAGEPVDGQHRAVGGDFSCSTTAVGAVTIEALALDPRDVRAFAWTDG